jgi:hypothetical protein
MNCVAWVRERTIPTERPSLADLDHGVLLSSSQMPPVLMSQKKMFRAHTRLYVDTTQNNIIEF